MGISFSVREVEFQCTGGKPTGWMVSLGLNGGRVLTSSRNIDS